MSYNMEIKEIEPIRIAFMRYKGMSDQANKVFPNVRPWACGLQTVPPRGADRQ